MKKILAILLAGVMSVTAFGFNASAVEKTDAEIQQEKLGYILNLNKDIWLDCAVIYDGVWPSIMDNAREVYDTDGLSADEYTVALKQVYDMYYDAPLVNIEDATLVQKYVVHIENLTGAQKMLTNEKNYENITVTTATNLQKHIVGLEPEFKNNDIFIDEQRCVSSLDDTLRWYNYCNFNICPRRNDVTSGTYIDNNFICMDKIFGYRIWCDKNGYDYL